MSATAEDTAALLEGASPLCIVAVVPARNERTRIGAVIETMPACVTRIIVVDDASEDETGSLAKAADPHRVVVVRHPAQQGVGAAIETGYARAFEEGADVAVVLAGDGQMDPEDMHALLAPLHAKRAGYVKGNRLGAEDARAQMSTLRWLGIHVLSLSTRIVSGLDVGDTQCGYTAITRSSWRALRGQRLWSGYGYPNDMLVRLAKQNVVIEEVPVQPVYLGKRGGMGARHALFVVPFVLARAWWHSRGDEG